jgi:hypothetical protein
MSSIRNSLLANAFGVALFLSLAGSASAAPSDFTWSPSSATTSLNGGNIVGANNFNVADFASIPLNSNTGTFTEVGALNILQFLHGGNIVASSGLGSTYSLYLTFTATGTLPGIPGTAGTSTNGTFTSLTYQLIGSTSGTPTFTVTNGNVSIGNAGTTEVLAYGSLVPGTGIVTLTNTGSGFSPTANAELTVNECAAAGQGGVCTGDELPFFVSPLEGLTLATGNFSATDSVTTLVLGNPTSFVNLVGGGGNVTFQVPEPATLAVFGAGLLALGAALRRRRSRG